MGTLALLGLIFGIIGTLGSIGIGVGNMVSQKHTNDANIESAKESIDKQLTAAKEDREFNSNIGQYRRLLSIGLPPATARQAVSGRSDAVSGLSAVSQMLPQRMAPQLNADLSGLNNVSSTTTVAQQIEGQKELANLQASNESALLAQKHGYDLELRGYDNILDGFNRSEVINATKTVNQDVSDIETAFVNMGEDLYGLSYDEMLKKLSTYDSELYGRLKDHSSIPAWREVMDSKWSRYQAQRNDNLSGDKMRADIALQKSVKAINDFKISELETLKPYYPEMAKLAIQAKRNEGKLQSEEIRQYMNSNKFFEDTAEQRKRKLGFDVDIAELQKEYHDLTNSNQKESNRRQKFENDFREKHAESDRNWDKAGTVINGVTSIAGMVIGGASAGSLIGMRRSMQQRNQFDRSSYPQMQNFNDFYGPTSYSY